MILSIKIIKRGFFFFEGSGGSSGGAGVGLLVVWVEMGILGWVMRWCLFERMEMGFRSWRVGFL